MTTKNFVAIAALALSTLSIASAKSYEILLPTATQVGAVQLAAGQYRVKVEGSNAVFTNVRSEKSYTAPAKIETTQKHEDTAVQTKKDAAGERMESIDLGGSNQTLGFEF
ncbi:MAG TPA: hypothetical protein VN736_10050 [Candidatus Limnocylindrales bacterium]|nr:hypothetical protein [Candidatus Limnocylindrales bacterium]